MAERRKRRLLPEEDMAVTFADIINNPITRVDLSFLKADEQGGAIGYAPITGAPLVEAAEPVIAPALLVAVPTSLAAADSTVSAATPDSADSGIVPTEDSNTVPTAVPDRSALAILTTPDSDLTPKADEQGGALGYAPITGAPLVEAAEPVLAPALLVAVPTSLAAADSTVSAASPDSVDSGIVPTEDSNTVPTAVPDRSALATLTTPDSDLTPVTESLEYENQDIFPFEVRPEFQQVAGPFASRTDKTIVSAAGSDTTDPGTIPAIHSSTVSSTDSARSVSSYITQTRL